MALIKFIKSGLLTTIQDSGRKGLAFYAIPNSGVMDSYAAQKANLLVGNPVNNPLLECHMQAPEIMFESGTNISITGADMLWTINGINCTMNQLIKIKSGDVLSGSVSSNGLRSYVAIKGKPNTQKSFGSYSSYPYANLGANQGKYIKKGDAFLWETNSKDSPDVKMDIKFRNHETFHHEAINASRGPEYHLLDEQSKIKLISSSFTITSQSNRMGARLLGPNLNSNIKLVESRATLPGFIQLLPSGQLIVILQDGQTTGGYPRVAFLTKENLNMFNQMIFNKPFKLVIE